MSDRLPEGWAIPLLGDVVQIKQGNSKLTKKLYKPDGRYVAFSGSGPDGRVDHHEYEGKAIVLSAVGARCGKCFKADGKWTAIANTAVIRPFLADDAHLDYLFFMLNNEDFWPKGGTAQPFVQTGLAQREITIMLPPLAEQRRIVAKLETLLGKVDACQRRLARIPHLLKRFRQSVLAAACSGRLTADWRDENPEVENASQLIAKVRVPRAARFQDASVRGDLDLPELAETWAWTNLRFLLSPAEAFCYGVVQPGENDPAGAFLIRAGDLNFGRVDTSALRRIPLSVHHDYRRAQLVGGEILVTVVGAGIGETAIAQAECAGFNIARAVAKLPVREFSARYVHLWLSTSRALTWMKGDSREVARPTLNLEQLQTLPVPIPPLPEQDEIVRRVEQLFTFAEQLETRFAKAQAHVDKLMQSLLAKAFRGELVPQNPNDEPASALLARIRSGANGAKKLPRRKAKVVA